MPKKNEQKRRVTRQKGRSPVWGFNPVQSMHLWLKDKHPVLKFLLGFTGCMAVFYIFYHSSLYRNFIEAPFLNILANISNGILQLLGHNTEVAGALIFSKSFSVDIRNGCDGLEAIAIFVSGILIFPVPFRRKVPGLAYGILTLMVLNLLRIAGLYLIGLNFSPTVFEVFHVQGGFIIFTMISVILLFAWMNWAMRQPQPPTPGP